MFHRSYLSVGHLKHSIPAPSNYSMPYPGWSTKSFLDGVNQSEDGTLAIRNALMNMIALLMERGWSREQAYCICSVAVDLKVSEVVDIPNFVVSAFLPLDIFED